MPLLGIGALILAGVLFVGWPREIAELRIALSSYMFKKPPEPSSFAVTLTRIVGGVLLLWAAALILSA